MLQEQEEATDDLLRLLAQWIADDFLKEQEEAASSVEVDAIEG